MIIIPYHTNTRNTFDGPAATNIGMFDITWPNITSNQQSCRGYFWGLVSQLTLGTPTFESLLIGSSAARFGYSDCGTIGTHYVRHLFKIAPLWYKKSQCLLDFNFYLSRWPSSGTTGLCCYTTGLLLGEGFLLHIFPFTYIHPLQNSQNTSEYSEWLSTMILQIFLNSTYYYRIL